jgi:hypothetical protein
MSDSYVINDLSQLALSIRKNAALSFSETHTEDLNMFITQHQVEQIILNHTSVNEEDMLVMHEDQYDSIFDEVREWIYQVGLSKLAAEDKIQCAWDNDSNSMIFWHS